MASDYFAKAFGSDGALVQDYLCGLSEAFDPPYIRGEKPAVCPEQAQACRAIPAMLEAFLPVIRKNAANEALLPNQRRSWEYLIDHAELCRQLSRMLTARAEGDAKREKALAEDMLAWCRLKEKDLAGVLDVYIMHSVYGKNLG